MRKIPEDIEKTTPDSWVVFIPGQPHARKNIQGVIILDSAGYYHPVVEFRSRSYKRGYTLTLKGAVKSIRRSLEGLDTP